MQTVAGNKRS